MRVPAPIRRPRTLALLGALSVVVLLSVVAMLDAAARARDVRREVYAARADLEQAQTTVQALAGLDAGHLPTDPEIEDALRLVRSANSHLQAGDDRLGYLPAVLPVAGLLPPARGAGEVPALIDVGLAVTSSADILLTTVLPLLEEGPTADESVAGRARAVFVEDGETLDAALADLESLRDDVTRLQGEKWGRWLDAAPLALQLLDDSLQEVPRAREVFGSIRAGFDSLFGFDGTRTYLVAGLNESELRPTGGFMGTLGVVTVEDGRLTASTFERVYSFEREMESYPAPPEDLTITMGAGWWLLRDANWWADFPTSAESTLDLFEQHQGIRADGVISINTLFTGRLVEVFAPLDLPEYPVTLTAENWRGVMERTLLEGRDTAAGGASDGVVDVSAEEAYLAPLMQDLIERSQSVSPEQMPAFFAALVQASGSRDFQVYMRDDTAEAMLDSFGVSGRLEVAADGTQVIAVVDSNVSWSKVQPGISRDITVILSDRGTVDIITRWQNRVSSLDPLTYPRAAGPGALLGELFQPGFFGDYVRVYVPIEATEIRTSGGRWERRSEERGFRVVRALMAIPDGSDGSLVVSYRLATVPETTVLWKQGGQATDHLRVVRNEGDVQTVVFDGPFTRDVRIGP